MRRILLTGMSGTGKSAVVRALTSRGFKAIDTDYGWCETAKDGEWIWSERRIQELLCTEDTEVLYVAGCASNQGKFYDQFDLVVLLSAPADLLVERVRNRTDNPFGRSAEQLAQIMRDLEVIEPLLRMSAGVEIETARPIDDIVDEIACVVAGIPARPSCT